MKDVSSKLKFYVLSLLLSKTKAIAYPPLAVDIFPTPTAGASVDSSSTCTACI